MKCIENLNREIALHKSLNHKNIVKLYGFFIESNHVNIILDYLPNGNLFGYIRYMRDIPLPKVSQSLTKFLGMFLTICKTIKFLHSKNILHRDIKPENILLDSGMNPVFCDFGWSIQLDFNESRDTFCGTLEYIPPEIFKGEQYNKPADIWSLGILLYEMLHGCSPFKGRNYREVSEKVLNGSIQINDSLSPRLHNLIKTILKTHPADRPSIDYIIDEVTSVILNNDIHSLKLKEKGPLMLNTALENAKERIVVFTGSEGTPISLAAATTTGFSSFQKASSPNLVKNTLSNMKLGRLGDSKTDLKSTDQKSGPPIDLNSILNRNKRVDGSKQKLLGSSEKQPLTIMKAKSGSNLLLNRNQNMLTASSSDKKLSDSHSSRRKKIKVFVTSGTTDDRTNPDIEASLLNSTGFKDLAGLNRKESTGTEVEAKKTSKKDLFSPSLLKGSGRIKMSNDKSSRKLSNSKDKKVSLGKPATAFTATTGSLKQVQASKAALYPKDSKLVGTKQSPRVVDDKSKFNGKMSESHKHLCGTPKDRLDKEYFFSSMLYLQGKAETGDKDKEKASLILNKISQKISGNAKTSLDAKVPSLKIGLPQPALVTSPRTDAIGSGREMYKPKAKSFRSTNSVCTLTAASQPDKKKVS
jgi:serine/threonine protein kinase